MENWNQGQVFQFRVALAAQLLRINPSISEHQFHCLKLACLMFNISREKLDSTESFTDLYQLIEQKVPQYAPSLAYQMLSRVGVAETNLLDFKQFVIEQVRLEDNQPLDLLLTLAFILEDISERSYGKFKEFSRLAFLQEYHPSRISSRSYLLELFYDKDLINPDYLMYFLAWLYGAGCSFEVQSLRQYCARQGIDEPDYNDVEIPDLGEEFESDGASFSSLLERDGNSFNKFIISTIAQRRRCRYCTVKFTSCAVVLIALPIILTICSLISLLLFQYGFHQVPSLSVVSIGANKTVLANRGGDCYSPLWTRNVAITPSDYSTITSPISVYSMKEEDIQYTTDVVNNTPYTYAPLYSSTRVPMNLYKGDQSVYSASNSTLTYFVSARSDVNFTHCPLEVYLFTDFSSYSNYIKANPTHSTTIHSINSAQCPLKVTNTTQEYILNYYLKPNTFYFVALGALSGLYFNITLTGAITKLNVSGLTPPHICSFNFDSDVCRIAITNYSIPYSFKPVCLAIHLPQVGQFNVTLSSTAVAWNIGSIVSLPSLVTVLIVSITILLLVIIYITWQHKKESKALAVYSELLID